MTPSEKVIALVNELDFHVSSYFLGGSAGLALRDLRDIGDLDVGVTTRYWFELLKDDRWSVFTPDPDMAWERCDPPYLYRTVNGTEVHVFHSWRRRGAEETPFNDFNLVFEHGIEVVKGIPCIKLSILLRQKVDAVLNGEPEGNFRPKDIRDVGLITDWMKR